MGTSEGATAYLEADLRQPDSILDQFFPPQTEDTLHAAGRSTSFVMRSRDQFATFWKGLELVEPGITVISEWRSDAETRPDPADVACLGYLT